MTHCVAFDEHGTWYGWCSALFLSRGTTVYHTFSQCSPLGLDLEKTKVSVGGGGISGQGIGTSDVWTRSDGGVY